MRILIITPMLKEFHCAREVFGAKEESLFSDYRFASASRKGQEVHLLQCGFDPEGSLELYWKHFSGADCLFDSGSCGSLVEGITVGDVYSIHSVVRPGDDQIMLMPPDSGLPSAGIVETGGAVDSEKARKKMAVYAELCSMESYRACLFARDKGIDFMSFRVVTDRADGSMKEDFRKNLRPACQKLYRFLRTFTENLSH
ncbi:MAG: hypothetical protein PQJ58_04050 [Spirochaetales bacterium]|nr:hypothetical protein [Spirochaetales bacterium]